LLLRIFSRFPFLLPSSIFYTNLTNPGQHHVMITTFLNYGFEERLLLRKILGHEPLRISYMPVTNRKIKIAGCGFFTFLPGWYK
jgi:hypothetical protein